MPNVINQEAQKLAVFDKIDDRIDKLNEQQCFVTVKDHKEDFRTNPKFRLINPAKSEMGKLSKQILDRINEGFFIKKSPGSRKTGIKTSM